MKEYKVEDKINAICFFCKKLQIATLAIRDVICDGKIIKDVPAWVCDECEHTVGIPHQYAHLFKENCDG